MNLLRLRFVMSLDYRPFEASPFHPHGAIFTRWLPNGHVDAIELDPGTHLKVWFERFGFVQDSGFAVYDISRRDLDSRNISRQERLESGPLMGSLELEVADTELSDVQEQRLGDEQYIRLGKRIIKELILPRVAAFIDALRTEFGQYWIAEPIFWDSRSQSLGSYCSNLQLQWSLDGQEWKRFVPDEQVQHLSASLRNDFQEYLSEPDWKELRTRTEWFCANTGSKMLTRAHEFYDQDDLKDALINGVTALELALDRFLRERLSNKDMLRRSEAFAALNVTARTIILAAPLVEDSALTGAVAAIELRNRIVHDGYEPVADDKGNAVHLMRIVSALLGHRVFRFPSADSRNAVRGHGP